MGSGLAVGIWSCSQRSFDHIFGVWFDCGFEPISTRAPLDTRFNNLMRVVALVTPLPPIALHADITVRFVYPALFCNI